MAFRVDGTEEGASIVGGWGGRIGVNAVANEARPVVE
jgi:hypothetical protein